MSQKTLVVQVPTARGSELRARLDSAEFDFRPVPHSVFSVKGAGVVATLYTSGKLVIQGDAPELFVQRFVDFAQPVASRAKAPGSTQVESVIEIGAETEIGSDECGKGDYFGPLVVVAVRIEPGDAARLAAGNVRDSKTLSDEQCLRMGAALRGHFAHSVASLMPSEYNATYRPGRLNDLLADLHTRAITELARPGVRVIVDQFAAAALMERRLRASGVKLEQRPRAEAHPAVAAASIIAREQFLSGLKELSEQFAVDLHKGAGDPVDRAAGRFAKLHGLEALREVAKLHFKNTQKIR